MRKDIHPDYVDCVISCGCGESFQTRATVPEIRVEICSQCHPFYTGKQKFVDTAGRVEKFQRRYNWQARQAELRGEKKEENTAEVAETTEATVQA